MKDNLFGLVIGAALVWSCVGSAQAADKEKLSEAQAVGVMLTSNAGEMTLGQTVAARTADPQVRAYAMRLLDDHLSANRELLGVLEKANVKAAGSMLQDKKFTAAQKEIVDMWSAEAGAAMDKKFLTEAITDHANDLKAIDETLLPAATTEEVRSYFTATRAVVASHLQDACKLGAPMGIDTKGCQQQQQVPGTK